MTNNRIGVFVCHCGINIAGVVQIEKLVESLQGYPGTVHIFDYKYMCSDPGQNLIRQAVEEKDLNGVVVACCSPSLHEKTFRSACSSAGLNNYLCEIANIREHCAWVHSDKEKATDKAREIIQMVIEKVRLNDPLEAITLPVNKKALVIGGGISGIQGALTVANGGYPVVLIERNPELGGRMAGLSKTFLTLEHSQKLLSSKLKELTAHPEIKVLTGAELENIEGYLGNFKASIRQRNIKEERLLEEEIGAVILATGFELMPRSRIGEYDAEAGKDVIDGLEFEKMLATCDEGPDKLRRPSDGRIPREIVFVQCAGSRDPERGVPYCSKICCMYTAKQAMLYKKAVPDGQAYVFYIDIRTGGKGSEEFVQEGIAEEGLVYLRGKVSRLFEDGNKIVVWGADTLMGKKVEIAADLVVLASAIVPSRGAIELGKLIKAPTDEYGFFSEIHPKLRPLESATAGIFLAGSCRFPMDIPDSITHASGAAGKILALFSGDEISQEPTIALVDEDICSGCGLCVAACPYGAREVNPRKKVAEIIEVLCQACGACVSACPNGATQQRNLAADQCLKMVDAAL